MTQKIKETSAIKLQVVSDVKNGKEVNATITFSGINKAISDDDFMDSTCVEAFYKERGKAYVKQKEMPGLRAND